MRDQEAEPKAEQQAEQKAAEKKAKVIKQIKDVGIAFGLFALGYFMFR